MRASEIHVDRDPHGTRSLLINNQPNKPTPLPASSRICDLSPVFERPFFDQSKKHEVLKVF